MCNRTVVRLYETNCSQADILHLYKPRGDDLWIDGIKIIDNQNNQYLYNTFCSSSLSFPDLPEAQENTTTCSHFNGQKKWSYFCMEGDENCNIANYEEIDIVLPSNLSINEVLLYQFWELWDKKCNLFTNSFIYVPRGLNFTNALKYCQQTFGTSLASIHSVSDAQEAENLGGLCYNDRCWIGLSDMNNEKYRNKSGWIWSDDTSFDYENWGSGEPSQSGNEDCVWIRPDGKWNDVGCDATMHFLCNVPDATTVAPISDTPTASDPNLSSTKSPTFADGGMIFGDFIPSNLIPSNT